MTGRPFVLLDRDGTLIIERHYLSDPDQVELLPGCPEGLRQLQAMGLGLLVITNQSGIGRGIFSEDRLGLIHERLSQLLRLEAVSLDGIYFCPHTPDDDCDCRKPKSGMIERAAQAWSFTPQRSFVIGDKPCDIEAGRRVGATTILVRTGYGAEVEKNGHVADFVVDNLVEAAQAIKNRLASRGADSFKVNA
jgi:D-glycero-D-manno-heptose 1,7-bisphosphate phosphatase